MRTWRSRNGASPSTPGATFLSSMAQGVLAIKPSGVDYTLLTAEDMVVLDLDGMIVEGTKRPSSDAKTHIVLYRNFSGLGGIVHTHSTFATAWAQARRPIPIHGTTHADHLAKDIPCTEVMSDEAVERDYEEQTGQQILTTFKGLDPMEVPMVLVAGHGPFAWGNTPEKAVYNAAVLEEIARIAFITLMIDPCAPRLPDSLVHKHYERKHGPNAYYGQK